mgnify:CR=1 FL=1
MERLVCLLIGYIFGLFQTGYFYGKTQGVDIRKMGSGNAGSTNALRTMGIKAGMITLLGDCFKCVIAVLVVRGIYGQSHADILPLLSLYTGFGAVLGHNFPFYQGRKGNCSYGRYDLIYRYSDCGSMSDCVYCNCCRDTLCITGIAGDFRTVPCRTCY